MIWRWAKHIAIILLWLLIWQLASIMVGNAILLAGPLEIAQALFANIQKLSFWMSVSASSLRVLVGFLAALATGLVLAALAWRYKLLAELLNPPVLFIKSVPIVCFVVIILFWVGAANTSAVAVFLVAFPAIYFACKQGLESCDPALGELTRLHRLSRPRKLLAYYWPGVLPFMMASGRVAVAMSWKAGVAAELIGMPLHTIGERIYQAKLGLSSADIFAWTIVIVLLGLLSERLFFWLLEKTEDWCWKLALPKPRVGGLLQQAEAAAGESRGLRIKSAMTQTKPNSFAAKTTTSTNPSTDRAAAVVVSNISKAYDGRLVLDSLSFQLAAGGRYILDAPSGGGKTTLLRLLAGLERPTAGRLEAPKAVSMLFQESRLFERHSALDNLQLLAGRYHSPEALRELLERLLPAECLAQPVSSLSGGQRRRVELCRALAYPSRLLLLDEPFTGLDAESRRAAQEFVLEQLKGRSLIVASHDKRDSQAMRLQRIPALFGQQVVD